MPKRIDHAARRGELADAAIRVIARDGLTGATLALVAEESGWSIGSIRYYFPTKDALLTSALWRVGELVDTRIRQTADGMSLADLRTAATQMLFHEHRDEAVVYLAFLAHAAITPALAEAAEDAQSRLQEPLSSRIAHAVQAGELPSHLDSEHEATRLRVLLDGLRLQLVTTPLHMTERLALDMLNTHLADLASKSTHAIDSTARRR